MWFNLSNTIRNIKIKKQNNLSEVEEYYGEVLSYDPKSKKYECIFDDGTPSKFTEQLSITAVIDALIDDEIDNEIDDEATDND